MRMGNLPAEMSSFVDRRDERAELKRLLMVSRLVTVTGVGGVGKTRTALRVAAEVRRAFPDGVWWVELSALTDAELLGQAVAETLRVQDQTVRPQVEVLAEFLAGRRLLLVLDTCEHLVDGCADLVNAVLAAAPGVRVLMTSRQPLGLAGEHLFAVGPLPVPESHHAGSGAGLALYPGVELFVERARAADAGFTMTESNQAAVALLCRRLDGIPLAIELAAVRLRALSADQILTRLDHRFGLLTGGSRVGATRHETLRTAIGWSHELCTAMERLLWARVSVFAGDFDLAAVEQVCADDRLAADGMLELLAGLVDKSILLRAEYPSGMRYRLLDTIREYGQELLRDSGEDGVLGRRHRDYYLRLARRCEAEWCGPDQVAWCERLDREHANLRVALEFCLADSAEHQAGLELAGALRYFWLARGLLREGRHYLDRALALDPAPGPELTKALWACAWLAVWQGDLEAGNARLAQCRPYAGQQGDVIAAAWINHLSGSAATLSGDLPQALRLGEQAAELHRHGGDPRIGLLFALSLQAMALALAGESDRAIALAEQHRTLCDQTGERWARSFADYMIAMAELGRGDAAAAVTYARDALRFKRQLGDIVGIAAALDVLAAATAALGQADRTARLIGVAHQLWNTFGLPQFGSPDLAIARRRCERQARDILGDQAYEAAFTHGLNLDLEAAIDYALDEEHPRQPAIPWQTTAWAPLTRRERQIAELVAEGLTNKEIAARLMVSTRTADSHIEHILTKLAFTNRAQIAAWVTEQHRGNVADASPSSSRR